MLVILDCDITSTFAKIGRIALLKKMFFRSDIRITNAVNTYDPGDAKKLIKPLMEDKADVVLGFRIRGEMEDGSVTSVPTI